jgi:hypothetical protein
LAKTEARAANWVSRRVPTTPNQFPYELALPDSRVLLWYATPVLLPDSITLALQNAEGETVDEWHVEQPDFDPDAGETLESADPDGDWRLLYALFAQVHRQATGYDRVITDVEKALAELGVIGKPAR